MKSTPEAIQMTPEQQAGLDILNRGGNVFLTGGAGTGKSTLVKSWIREGNIIPLASTGTAALLLGGRTFHSFFGIGILEGGKEATIERALKNGLVVRRLKNAQTILIDEVSMLGGQEWEVAEAVARKARESRSPWGGIRIVAVGDFAQLPPVTRPWCFLTQTWADSDFRILNLQTLVRSQEVAWNEILGELRWGQVSSKTDRFLQSRTRPVTDQFSGTRLFSKRISVDRYNEERLNGLKGESFERATVFSGKGYRLEEIKRQCPIPSDRLILKRGALVMFRHNDPEARWVNGSIGVVQDMKTDVLKVQLLSGKEVEVVPVTYSLLDAEGKVAATATNFPLNLAWACTIHKAQGATIDQVHVDLAGTWEHGQAYVALSRVRRSTDLSLESWSRSWLKTDPVVRKFYQWIDEVSGRASGDLSSDLSLDFSSDF